MASAWGWASGCCGRSGRSRGTGGEARGSVSPRRGLESRFARPVSHEEDAAIPARVLGERRASRVLASLHPFLIPCVEAGYIRVHGYSVSSVPAPWDALGEDARV